MLSVYTSVFCLLGDDAPSPALIDSLAFEYQGIQVHAYGTLHALTGGTNKSYVDAVNQTITEARGLRLGEQGMRAMYKGLDGELEDWVQLPFKDVCRLALSLVFPPHRAVALVTAIAREKLTKNDRFGAHGVRRLQDIGGSLAFHRLSPVERRRVAGFPDAPSYLLENLRRRRGEGKLGAPNFPDPDWYWLHHIEPHANIPCRSVHMLEFAVELARIKGVNEVSLFVGEVHNSDMHWYQQLNSLAGTSLPDWAWPEVDEIRRLAREHADTVARGKTSWRRAVFATGVALGLGVPVAAYVCLGLWLLARWQ